MSKEQEDWYGQHQWQCGYERGWDKGYEAGWDNRGEEEKNNWVGLTDEDLSVCDEDGVLLARYWETKLKEKNT